MVQPQLTCAVRNGTARLGLNHDLLWKCGVWQTKWGATEKPVTVIYVICRNCFPSIALTKCQQGKWNLSGTGMFSVIKTRDNKAHTRGCMVWKHWKSRTAFICRQMFEWDYISLFVIQAQPADVTAVSFEGRMYTCQSKKCPLYERIPSASRAAQLCSVCKNRSAVPRCGDWTFKQHRLILAQADCWKATPNRCSVRAPGHLEVSDK